MLYYEQLLILPQLITKMNEIEQLKAELKQTQLAYQMATQISQLKGNFLARTSHELRSPISTLMGLHQLILCNLCESPEEEREFIEQAYQASQKLIKIIDNIIDVSKIEYGKIPLKIRSFPLEEVFLGLYDLTHLQAANRNIRLEIVSPDSDLCILVDLEKFLQALLSLVDSSITLASSGSIKIRADKKQESQLVSINLELPCIFDLEYVPEFPIPELNLEAVKAFSKTLEMSTGMKFLLAKNLTESMQGHLEIIYMSPHNQLEKLTQIQCLIPLASVETVSQEVEED